MLSFRDLAVQDRALLKEYLDGRCYECSELSFANVFIWRKGWKIQISPTDNAMFVRSILPATGEYVHFQPVVRPGGDEAAAVETALDDLESHGSTPRIYSVNEEFACHLAQKGYVVSPLRDMWEYVYRTEDLVKLEGRKYHGKRNHIHQFLKGYSYTWRDLTPADLPQCLEIFDAWAQPHEIDANITGERIAVEEAVTRLDELGLKGCMVLIEDVPAAFSVAERITPNMVLIHLEKARDYPGLYTFINQQFLERDFADTQWVNRQEDMGIPGLRRAKESYYPERFVQKFMISRG